MKTALITGANGTVGTSLIRTLQDDGWVVTAFSRQDVSDVGTLEIDLLDPSSLDVGRVGDNVDAVFHLAAMMPDVQSDNSSQFMAANSMATMYLIESAAKHGVKNFVYASSASVIGMPDYVPQDEKHPLNPIFDYSISKLSGELACQIGRNMGMKVAALRLASIYGAGMAQNTVLPLFVQRALNGQNLYWHGNGARSQDFVYVDDISQAMLKSVIYDADGVYCIGSGVSTTMRGLAEQVVALIPGVEAIASGEKDVQDGVLWQSDIGAAIQDFQYKPVFSLEDGLGLYIDSLKNGAV